MVLKSHQHVWVFVICFRALLSNAIATVPAHNLPFQAVAEETINGRNYYSAHFSVEAFGLEMEHPSSFVR